MFPSLPKFLKLFSRGLFIQGVVLISPWTCRKAWRPLGQFGHSVGDGTSPKTSRSNIPYPKQHFSMYSPFALIRQLSTTVTILAITCNTTQFIKYVGKIIWRGTREFKHLSWMRMLESEKETITKVKCRTSNLHGNETKTMCQWDASWIIPTQAMQHGDMACLSLIPDLKDRHDILKEFWVSKVIVPCFWYLHMFHHQVGGSQDILHVLGSENQQVQDH